MSKNYPLTFTPGQIGSLNLKNRLLMSLYPTKYVKNNRVNERLTAFYRARAKGGVALIVLDGACLDYPAVLKGSIQLRMDNEDYAAGLRSLVAAVQSYGAKAFMQLDYPGVKRVPAGTPGAFERRGAWVLPLLAAATTAELYSYIVKIGAGAARAREIGYDGVELQADYGAFISQLLSPLKNKRSDEFGGGLKNRARFLLRAIKEIKNRAGADFPLEVKFSASEMLPGGFNLKEAKIVASWMETAGADAILVNAGSKKAKKYLLPTHSLAPGVNIKYAAALKKVVDIPIIAAGKISEPEMVEEILAAGQADFVAMTRALIADPDLPNKAAADRPQDIRRCIYCLDDCADKGAAKIGRACTVNPFAGQESEMLIKPTSERKRVWIVGGGPAGMQAALILLSRGHYVELFEKENQLGGQFNLASLAPNKGEVAAANQFLIHQIKESGVKINLGYEVQSEDVRREKPDVVVVAAGSLPSKPKIPGIERDFVREARDFLSGQRRAGRRVVIIGGGDVGCELADLLAGGRRQVTVVEMLPEVLPKMKSLPRQELLASLDKKGVRILTSTKIVAIGENVVTTVDENEKQAQLSADNVIYAVGGRADNRLAKALKGKVKVFTVGDADRPGTLGMALRSAVRTAIQI